MRSADVTLQPGAVFATDYRIVARLDEGGMGLLYRAEQISTGEERALKVLRPSLLADGISRDRFEQEATIGANIPSDHVVKVIGAGIDDETGIPWISMELLRGDNLLRVVRAKGALPRRDVIEIFAQLCHGLAAAHRAGIVHRDLKPENIFIARTNRREAQSTVKLLDFGIAKMMQAYETSVTATAIVGSPLWMAPEQVRLGRVRPATDVWALGLLAFWMLTGKYYWRAAQQRDVGQAEALLHEKLYAPIDLASKRAAALGVDGRLPLGFDDWFRRCVARDPDDRFPDAERAFDGLRALLARRSRGFAAHARGAMLGASIAGFALAGAYGWSAYRATARAEVARPPTVRRALSITPPAASATAMQREPVAPRAVVPAPIAPTPVSRIAESSVATSNAPIAAARTRGSGTTIESRVHVTPQAPGYLFRAHTDHGAMRCSERGHTRAWEVVPAWAAQITERLRAREATLATERRMAQRSPTDEITNRVTQDERLLEQERALATTQVERSVVGERARSAALASGSRCLDGGLHVDGTRVFAVWCCP